MKKILVVGHSHMHALQDAPNADDGFEFFSCVTIHGGKVRHRPFDDYRKIDGSAYSAIALHPGGNQHILLGLVNHPSAPFDFYLPERPDLSVSPDATLLAVSLVERILRRLMISQMQLTTALAALFKGMPICQIETPPPFPIDHIERNPHGFVDVIRQHGVSPLGLRYKIWRLHSQIVRENCAKLNVSFVEIPRGVQAVDGSLAADYLRVNDPFHGNSAYGALVLEQIRAAAEVGAHRDEDLSV